MPVRVTQFFLMWWQMYSLSTLDCPGTLCWSWTMMPRHLHSVVRQAVWVRGFSTWIVAKATWRTGVPSLMVDRTPGDVAFEDNEVEQILTCLVINECHPRMKIKGWCENKARKKIVIQVWMCMLEWTLVLYCPSVYVKKTNKQKTSRSPS